MTILNSDVQNNEKIISFNTGKTIEMQMITLHEGEPLVFADENGIIHKIYLSQNDS